VGSSAVWRAVLVGRSSGYIDKANDRLGNKLASATRKINIEGILYKCCIWGYKVWWGNWYCTEVFSHRPSNTTFIRQAAFCSQSCVHPYACSVLLSSGAHYEASQWLR